MVLNKILVTYIVDALINTACDPDKIFLNCHSEISITFIDHYLL